ncbi:DUF3053 domain-containing protein [Novosphingobium sp. G106]|uniref:DUF3053 family protein n=1 Tax=Novosphingobium sp. G106 TaxID=2849500 RepID=UPI001C2DEB0A|nr:DUF3053 family protein [Novosphingobium sp. G106]MBV1692502.1 DUF3053 domain-containing protein [Novosphingobium sp. G106]
MSTRRAGFALTWAVAATLCLAGCVANDARQSAEFSKFLQARVLDKPGVHVPQLTDDERTSFGHYAEQYAVITDFNKAMDQSVSPKLTAAMQAGSITSIGDLSARLAQLKEAKAGINAMESALGEHVARADAAHAKLEQPADLKPVYDKTYDRLVTQPAAALKSIAPVMNKVLDQAIDLGSYIDQHRASVRISGPMIETGDPAVQSAINEKLQTLQTNQQAVQAAQSRLRSVVYGS